MTTLAAARTALASAVGASDDYVDPPGCMVFSDGSPLTPMGGDGSVPWSFRVMCYTGARSDNATQEAELIAYVATKVAILIALAGFTVDSVTPTLVRSIAGGEHYAADIAVTTRVTMA